MRIIVIEDEASLCRSITDGLRMDGYEVDSCGDGIEALDLCLQNSYDLILLDLNLPGMDGMEVLSHFRKENTTTPVIILSARIALSDKIAGLDEGANDYLTKPFHFEELEARIRSLTRRRFIQEQTVLSCGDLTFDTRTQTAAAHSAEIRLTRKETGILEYLLLHQERFVSQEALIEHVWDQNADEFSNSIRVHVSSLRKKLRAALGYDPIRNKVGCGYRIGGDEQ